MITQSSALVAELQHKDEFSRPKHARHSPFGRRRDSLAVPDTCRDPMGEGESPASLAVPDTCRDRMGEEESPASLAVARMGEEESPLTCPLRNLYLPASNEPIPRYIKQVICLLRCPGFPEE